MDGLKPPQTLCLDSRDLSRTWKTWREEFMLYVDLTVPADDEEKKVKLFRYLVGESGRELLDTLMGDVAGDAWRLDDIIEKFDLHCNPSINETVERYRFFTRQQGSSENIDSYVTELKLLTKTCNFGTFRDSLVRDRIVCGLHDAGMRERLLREKNLTLDTCIQLCRAAELSRENSEAITGPKVVEVYTLQGALHQGQKRESTEYVPQQHVCKEEEDEQQLCHQERKSSLDQEEPEPQQMKEEQEGEWIKQEETDTSALNLYILTLTDLPQQHVWKEGVEQQLCHQERKSSLDQEEPEPPQMKEEQEGEWIKQEETDTLMLTPTKEEPDQSLKLQLFSQPHVYLHRINVPQQHVCKEEEVELQLCHQERKSSLDQEEPEPPQMKEEQEGEWIKQEETDTSALNRQIRTLTGTKLYSCRTCGKSFNHKHHLGRHIIVHTGKKKTHTCTICSKLFNQKSNWTAHMRTHTGEKPYSCSACGKRFTRKTDLNHHNLTHTGIKPHICDTCGKSFSLKWDLQRHLKIHTGEKPYSCAICSKSFGHKSDVTVHMRTHTGEKPYSCSACGKKFGWKSAMNLHFRIHTGEKPYICGTCGRSFSLKNSLDRHSKVHADNNAQTS
ncbi:zinc finger and SCAN domain-containing protein 21-like isoform X2 [Cheilinus undulatus]|uniref:zinc finger and SCAN domain-containing protein 21-like isoform X2 n=1 Tax=Cheilinus undulatus TaxID=241271 RepID=UPI001BD6C4B7|nr:zinc finger and SCAN domain-containing protein 21-like isoform X2 [Cheilinus undulatus]